MGPDRGPGHGDPRVHRLPAADGAVLRRASTCSTCRSGWPSGCGSGPSSSPPGWACCTCPASSACAGPGPTAAALAYMLSPYFLQYAGRISVILLPWAGLPFMLGLTIVALRRGGWREPGALRHRGGAGQRHQRQLHHLRRRRAPSCGSSTPSSSCASRPGATPSAPRCASGCSRWAPACGGWPAWRWRRPTASTSSSTPRRSPRRRPPRTRPEIIRGLGYWYFYGSDHLGPWTTAAVRYTQDIWLLATSYAVPVLALVAAAFVRWRERAFFLVLLFVGLVLSVGPFPFSHPTADRGRPQVLHDQHHGGPGAALDRPGHARSCCWPSSCCWAAG